MYIHKEAEDFIDVDLNLQRVEYTKMRRTGA